MLTNELLRSREITHTPLMNSKRGFENHHFKSSLMHFNRPSLLWGVILSFVKLFKQGDIATFLFNTSFLETPRGGLLWFLYCPAHVLTQLKHEENIDITSTPCVSNDHEFTEGILHDYLALFV